jgi:hypothetical protein
MTVFLVQFCAMHLLDTSDTRLRAAGAPRETGCFPQTPGLGGESEASAPEEEPRLYFRLEYRTGAYIRVAAPGTHCNGWYSEDASRRFVARH